MALSTRRHAHVTGHLGVSIFVSYLADDGRPEYWQIRSASCVFDLGSISRSTRTILA